MRGSHSIQSLVLIAAKNWWVFGYSYTFAPSINHFCRSVSVTTKKRKFMFSWSKEAAEKLEVNPVVQDDL